MAQEDISGLIVKGYVLRDLIGEVREVQAIARRIAAILPLEADLDANYAAVKAATVNFDQM